MAISKEQADRLYWLGRYIERVHTTMRVFNNSIDTMIDMDDADYKLFCSALSIPSDIYLNRADFEQRYLFDQKNPDSLYSNLSRAYDNAIVLRSFITSESLAYIQMALDSLHSANIHRSAFLETQQVIDWILAFWGSIEETIHDHEKRNLMKVGKYVERLDLTLRLGLPYAEIERTVPRLINRLNRVSTALPEEFFDELWALTSSADLAQQNKQRILSLINQI